MNSKRVTLHLLTGNPKGIIKGHLGLDWGGEIIRAPRTKLEDLFEEINERYGVYILLNSVDGNIYIGESENLFERLKQHRHDEKKDEFTDIFIIKTSNGSLTKGHIQYLEGRLIEIANETKRANANGTNPHKTLPSADKDDMETFIQNLQIILPMMGLDFVLPIELDSSVAEKSTQPVFVISVKKLNVRMQMIQDEFFVLAKSQAIKGMSDDREIMRNYKKKKEDLIANGLLQDSGEYLVFTQNVPFRSLYEATVIVLGRSVNGRTSWVLEKDTQITYADWEEKPIPN